MSRKELPDLNFMNCNRDSVLIFNIPKKFRWKCLVKFSIIAWMVNHWDWNCIKSRGTFAPVHLPFFSIAKQERCGPSTVVISMIKHLKKRKYTGIGRFPSLPKKENKRWRNYWFRAHKTRHYGWSFDRVHVKKWTITRPPAENGRWQKHSTCRTFVSIGYAKWFPFKNYIGT